MLKSSGDRLMTLIAIRCVGFVLGLFLVLTTPLPNPAAWPYVITAGLTHYLYFWFLFNAYKAGDFSQVYPIARGSAPLIVALLTVLFAIEPLAANTIVAIIVMTVGIMLLSSAKGAGFKPVLFALGTGVTIAFYSYLCGVGIRLSGSRWSYIGWLELIYSVGLVTWGFTGLRDRQLAYWQSHWKQGLTAGVLSVGGYLIALWAMSVATIAAVVAVRETSALFGALIGAVVFKEALATRRIMAAILVVVGIALLVGSH